MTIALLFLVLAALGALGWLASSNPRVAQLGQYAFVLGVLVTLALSGGVLHR